MSNIYLLFLHYLLTLTNNSVKFNQNMRLAMLSRCSNCGGRKQIVGLGCIYHACPTCKGVGYVEIDELLEQAATGAKPPKANKSNKKIHESSVEYFKKT